MVKTLFDAHTHVNYETYNCQSRKALADEINDSEIAYAMDIGFDRESSLQAIRDAEENSWCYAVIGTHPHDTKTMSEETLKEYAKLAGHEKVKAIGEIGLDFYYDKSDREVQEYWFRKQIRLANELMMPIAIHSRDAEEETIRILKEEGAFSEERQGWFPKRRGPNGELLPDSRVQIHCFSGSCETARQYVKLGATISICGPVTFKNNRRTKEVVSAIPIEFLLIETDAPYLAPEPFRGKPNKAPYVRYTAEKIAEIKGLTYEEVAAATLENGKTFFNIR